MNEENTKQQNCNKRWKSISSIVKNGVFIFLQILLLLFFFIFVLIYGFSICRFVIYLLFVGVIFVVFLPQFQINKPTIVAIVLALLASFLIILPWTNGDTKNVSEAVIEVKPEKKKVETPKIHHNRNIIEEKKADTLITVYNRNKIEEKKADTLIIHHNRNKIEEKIELPDGTKIFRVTDTESQTIVTAVQNSYNPIEIHYTVSCHLSHNATDDELVGELNRFNGILELFERDSIHFALTPEYVHQKKELGLGIDDKIYEIYHSEYLYLISVAYFNRGAIYDRLGHPDKALLDYDKAVSIYSRSREYIGFYGFFNRGAILDYDKTVYGRNNEFYNGFGKRMLLAKNQALAYLHLKNHSKALDILDEAIAHNQTTKYPDAELYFYKGYVYLVIEDTDQAIKCFEKTVEIEDDYAEAYNYLGLANYRTGNASRAIWAFGKAIQSETDNISRYSLSGNKADWYIKRAVPYYYNRALVYRELGMNELATSDEEVVQKYE